MPKKKSAKPLSLLGKMRSDSNVKKFNRAVSTGTFSINTQELEDEITLLHAARITRSVKYKGLMQSSQKVLIESILQTQANRSRVVEIQMQCSSIAGRMSDAQSGLKDYLSSTYNEQLKEYRTIKEKDALLNRVFEDAIKLIKSLNAVIELSQYLVEDLDQAGFSLMNIRKVLEITSAKEIM